MLSSRVSLYLLHMLVDVHVSLATPHVHCDNTQLAANLMHMLWIPFGKMVLLPSVLVNTIFGL